MLVDSFTWGIGSSMGRLMVDWMMGPTQIESKEIKDEPKEEDDKYD